MAESITEEQFTTEALAFLDANAKTRQKVEATKWGEGSDSVGLLAEKSAEEEAEELRQAKEWKALEFAAASGWTSGPEQYGGRNLPASFQRLYQSLAARYDIPNQ